MHLICLSRSACTPTCHSAILLGGRPTPLIECRQFVQISSASLPHCIQLCFTSLDFTATLHTILFSSLGFTVTRSAVLLCLSFLFVAILVHVLCERRSTACTHESTHERMRVPCFTFVCSLPLSAHHHFSFDGFGL